MAATSGDDPYITWPPHPDPEVEEIFRQANRAGYVIFRHEGVYTLVSPDGLKTMPFLGRVVPSSAIWLAAHGRRLAELAGADHE